MTMLGIGYMAPAMLAQTGSVYNYGSSYNPPLKPPAREPVQPKFGNISLQGRVYSHSNTVITDSSFYYYLTMTRDQLRTALARAALTAKAESTFLYIKYIKNGEILELTVLMDVERGVDYVKSEINVNRIKNLVNNPEIKVLDVAGIHIHPYSARGVSETRLSSLLISDDDIESAFKWASILKRCGYNGHFDARVDTPYGEFILTPLMDAVSPDEETAKRQGKAAAAIYLASESALITNSEEDSVRALNLNQTNFKASYSYHVPAMKNVQSIYMELNASIKDMQNRHGSRPISTIGEAREALRVLDRYLGKFESAIAAARMGGVSEILLRPYTSFVNEVSLARKDYTNFLRREDPTFGK